MKLTLLSNVLIISWIIVTAHGWADELPPIVDRNVDFAKDIRPLFDQHCISCHGAEKQEAGLRLDSREAAMAGGDSGRSILPGKSADSRLIEYVSGVDPDLVMPPTGDKMTQYEVGLLRGWIERGADWPESESAAIDRNQHWAYQPIQVVSPPTLNLESTTRNPIDRFIIAKLQSLGLAPSPEADRTTLIRRLSLDLLGLLPSIAEVDTFIRDASPTAYESLVDRLLQSPHFGERWGRHWLDMARFADSDGYEKDNARPDAYRWRDWVIDAINDDMPFDQFTVEQLAGDLLPDATNMQRLATAFHRQTLTNTEGGADQEQFRVEACFDRTETTGAIWLGLTVGCARCHSHKYDAISQREYYQLYSFFNNGDEQTHVVPKSVDEIETYQVAKREYDAKVTALSQQLSAAQEQARPTFIAWETDAQAKLATSILNPLNQHTLIDQSVSSELGIAFELQADGSFLVRGKNPDAATYNLVGRANSAFDTIRIDTLSDESLPASGPGRVSQGNFVLSEITVECSGDQNFSKSVPLELTSAQADHHQAGKPRLAEHAIDGDPSTGWTIGGGHGKNHWVEFRVRQPQPESANRFLRISLKQVSGEQHTIGRFKLSLQTGSAEGLDLPKEIIQILAVPTDERNDQQLSTLLDHVSREVSSTMQLLDRLDRLKKSEPAKPELTVRVIAQRTKDPRETFVLRRGEFLEPLKDAQVQPAGFRTLPPLERRESSSSADRLDLARWLVSQQNPLPPRVTVNNIWRQLFGTGLVRTANDFGVRGDWPTHPELLDWLAAEFIGLNATRNSKYDTDANTFENATTIRSSPWSRKSLIRLICLSATYRQASQQTELGREIDPQNQWLSRQNRLRVEGEIVRDISLDVAGLLSPNIGGPSVFPSLPPGVAELSYEGNFKWTVSSGADQHRRGMYTFFKRTSPHPNLITFDCPDANTACVNRNASNTPLQALVALNNASFAEAARAFAGRILSLPGERTDEARLTTAFQICLARRPHPTEYQQLKKFLDDARFFYAGCLPEAKELIDNFAVSAISPAENAAWIATARVLINLDEFITRE